MGCNPAYGERFIDTATMPSDTDTLEILKALAVAFDDSHSDPHGVARPKIRYVLPELVLYNFV